MRADHVNVSSIDPARTVAFYRALGLELAGCLQLDGLYNLYMGTPGEQPFLEITVPEDRVPRSAGGGHFALAAGDLDAAVRALTAAGYTLDRQPYNPGGRPQWRVCFVSDPDGYRVELIEGTQMHTPDDPFPAGIG